MATVNLQEICCRDHPEADAVEHRGEVFCSVCAKCLKVNAPSAPDVAAPITCKYHPAALVMESNGQLACSECGLVVGVIYVYCNSVEDADPSPNSTFDGTAYYGSTDESIERVESTTQSQESSADEEEKDED